MYYFVVVPTDAFGNRIATSTQVSATLAAPAIIKQRQFWRRWWWEAATPPVETATVVLSGRAYPGSIVSILKDSILQSRVPVQESAAFTSTIETCQAAPTFLVCTRETRMGTSLQQSRFLLLLQLV